MSRLVLTGNSRIRERVNVTPAPSGPQLPTAIMALSPIGYWKLDEPSGTTATDSSGNGRNGTYTGSGFTLQGATGGDGNLYVDLGNGGNSSHINFADANWQSINDGSGKKTIFLLAKPDSVAGTTRQFLISKGAGSNFEYGFAVNESSAGLINGRVWTSGGSGIQQSQGTVNASTNWNAIAFCMNGVLNSDVIFIYRNGTDITNNTGSAASGYTNGTAALQIGWRADSPSGQYWMGGMAHVAIFDANLNSTQVGTLMSAADADGWY